MSDDTVKKIVGEIIDKSSLFKAKRRKTLRDKIGKLADDFPKAMALQLEVEKKVGDRLNTIDTHKSFRQFLNPTLQSDYQKDTNPLEVLYWYVSEAKDRPTELDEKKELALKLAKGQKSKIVAVLKRALEELEKVKKYASTAPVPRDPLIRVAEQRYNYENMLKFFKRKL